MRVIGRRPPGSGRGTAVVARATAAITRSPAGQIPLSAPRPLLSRGHDRADLPFPASDARSGWVRLRTLILLRWLAVVGQSVAVLVAAIGLGMRLPHAPCAVVIGASVLFNLVAISVAAENRRLSEREAVLTLLFDLCQLGALPSADRRPRQPVRAPDHGAGDDQRLGAEPARHRARSPRRRR